MWPKRGETKSPRYQPPPFEMNSVRYKSCSKEQRTPVRFSFADWAVRFMLTPRSLLPWTRHATRSSHELHRKLRQSPGDNTAANRIDSSRLRTAENSRMVLLVESASRLVCCMSRTHRDGQSPIVLETNGSRISLVAKGPDEGKSIKSGTKEELPLQRALRFRQSSVTSSRIWADGMSNASLFRFRSSAPISRPVQIERKTWPSSKAVSRRVRLASWHASGALTRWRE